MGIERYGKYVAKAYAALTYEPGWCEENETGAWRDKRPVVNYELCTKCSLCWLYCPEMAVDRDSVKINYRYCKGCGICVEECPRKAISWEKEY